MLQNTFFNQDPQQLAIALLGKIIWRNIDNVWLGARIIETEAYYLEDKASHASLGWTEKRQGLFMPPGTIYMYYARGGDSFNISARGEGNAVLIKSAYPYLKSPASKESLSLMQQLNPPANGRTPRPLHKLCNGQTLLCRALNIKVADWDKGSFDTNTFFLQDNKEAVKDIVQTTRLGIPKGRDEHLPYRFIDARFAKYTTSNPITKREPNFRHIKR